MKIKHVYCLALMLFFVIIAAGCAGLPSVDYTDSPGSVPLYSPHFKTFHLYTQQDPFEAERTLWHGGTLCVGGYFYGAAVQVRGRGNTTWYRGAEKRPLRLRLAQPVQFLDGGHEARDWILLANHFDRSLLRNYTALLLARELGRGGYMSYLSTLIHVHLYVNGVYMGVYLLTDERDITREREPLRFHSNPAESEFFIEMDARAHVAGIYGDDFFIVNGFSYSIPFPRDNRRTAAHWVYARDYIDRVNRAMQARQWEEIASLIDIDSFVNTYIVHELMKNAGASSIFMSIQGLGENRRLFMGPPWDFDLSSGNRLSQGLNPTYAYLYKGLIHYWFRILIQMDPFFDAVAARWNQTQNVIIQTVDYVRGLAAFYSDDFERNFERHPIMGRPGFNIAPHLMELDTFAGQVDYLVNRLHQRIEWLDDFFNRRLGDEMYSLWGFVLRRNEGYPARFYVNNEPFPLWPPRLFIDGRNMVELNSLANILGLHDTFDAQTRRFMLYNDRVQLLGYVFDTVFWVNGAYYVLVSPPLFIKEYVYVPLFCWLPFFGFYGTFNHETGVIEIVL